MSLPRAQRSRGPRPRAGERDARRPGRADGSRGRRHAARRASTTRRSSTRTPSPPVARSSGPARALVAARFPARAPDRQPAVADCRRAHAKGKVTRVLLAADVGNTEIVLGVFDGPALAAHLAPVHAARAHVRRAGAAARRASWSIATSSCAATSPASCIASVVPDVTAAAPRDGRPLPPVPARDRGTRHEDRRAGPHRQPARGGRRPGREHARRVHAVRRSVDRRRLRHRRRTSTWSRTRASSSGGVIAPGLQIVAARALRADRAAHPGRACGRRASPIGKNTVEAIQSGLIYGTAGEVDAIVERIRAELERPTPRSSRPAASRPS